ncbi:MAG TPA: hypothetical protein PKY29_03290 [Ferruginibacter sp.]|nr:hypothetical protein [Ferruginibacter sp.]HRN80307.1 hypothetical protein [Ferruginibacter sp.]HRO16772.1 hypothetical protein [Ferruginibacter sp.]HRQ20308.1 hypothetical protein [Ferruginibacter sp.]
MSDNINTRLFFIKIVQSIGMGLLWMIVQIALGMYFKWAYFSSLSTGDTVPLWLNGIFYLQFVFTAWWVFRYIRNKWR